MATTTTPVSRAGHQRPALVSTTIGLLIFLGVSAVGGGIALVFGSVESGVVPRDSWLDAIPFADSWRVPGLVLGVGFGLGSFLAAYGMARRPIWPWVSLVERFSRHHWSWLATMLIGAGQVIWIALELAYLPGLSILQAIYGPLGLALAIMPWAGPVSRHLSVG